MINEDGKIAITLMGAGGKMGKRILNNLLNKTYHLFLCEKSQEGIKAIEEKGFTVTETDNAVSQSDFIILAVPDSLLGTITENIVPKMRKNTTLILLDPAAAYAKEIALRDDCTFIVTHPCHPGLFFEQETPEAREDMFGGVAAKQDIVIALLQGKEENFINAQNICKEMFSPVVNCHRVTVEQMTILEPAMAEVVGITAVTVIKAAVDEAIKKGVPEKAARAFMLGHLKVALSIVFKTKIPFSDACYRAIEYGYEKVFHKNWSDIFEWDAIKEVVQRMLHPITE